MRAEVDPTGVRNAKSRIAFGASVTQMYAPGTRRHIKAALKHGATMEEMMEVRKIGVAGGVQACSLGLPILQEELGRFEARAEKGRTTRPT